MTTGCLFFVFFFDWITFGRNKFTLINDATKTKCCSKAMLTSNDATKCGAQDLNSRIKVELGDSCLILDSNSFNIDLKRTLCLDANKLVFGETSDKDNKFLLSVKFGKEHVLLKKPLERPANPKRVQKRSSQIIIKLLRRALFVFICTVVVCMILIISQLVSKVMSIGPAIILNPSTGVNNAEPDQALSALSDPSVTPPVNQTYDDHLLILRLDKTDQRIVFEKVRCMFKCYSLVQMPYSKTYSSNCC